MPAGNPKFQLIFPKQALINILKKKIMLEGRTLKSYEKIGKFGFKSCKAKKGKVKDYILQW